jgi:hypothetical protein
VLQQPVAMIKPGLAPLLLAAKGRATGKISARLAPRCAAVPVG